MDFNVNLNVTFNATPNLTECVYRVLETTTGKPITAPTIRKETRQVEAPKAAEVLQPATSLEAPKAPEVLQPATESTPKTKEISDVEMRVIVDSKVKKHGKDKVFAILKGFGVKTIPILTQEQRRQFIEKLNAL